MKMLSLILASAATAALLGGSAHAQTAERPTRGADITREQAEQGALVAFGRLDANKDGVLDAADRDTRRAKRQEARFDRLDADKNGSITRAEFNAAQNAPANFAGRKRNSQSSRQRHYRGARIGGFGGGHLFRAGGNQSMTQTDFLAATLERFDRADANRDGTLTAPERREAFKALRDQRRAAGASKQS